MARFLVSGLINLETTLQVDRFPVDYTPVHYAFDRIASTISGVGFNVALALHTLGHEVRLLSLVGRDAAGALARRAMEEAGLSTAHILDSLPATPQSVIHYDAHGQRRIDVDLKDIQEHAYPLDRFEQARAGCDCAVLCNINFSRPLLAGARAAGLPVATDVHALSSLEDPYNRDFMAAADVLFMSGDLIPAPADEWALRTQARFGSDVVVVARGAGGALLCRPGPILDHVPAIAPPRIVSTIGAGDALFAAFLHGWIGDGDPLRALRAAVVFASHKIGHASAARGFLDAGALREAVRRVYAP